VLKDAYDVVPAITAASDTRRRRGRDRIAVTFDDGYAVTLHTALPLLQRHAVPATVFAVSGALGGTYPWDEQFAEHERPRALNAEELVELACADGITIGAHTISHPVLSAIGPDQQRAEIAGSKHALEELVGRPVDEFAYPHGRAEDYTPTTVTLVRTTGFAAAYTTRGVPVAPRGDPFETPRLAISNLDADAFAELLKRVLGR
jgi:peptidoglycan/xylan/chitin deacetylase (PgdA/CDA1 family)